jgi:hypothetical protein
MRNVFIAAIAALCLVACEDTTTTTETTTDGETGTQFTGAEDNTGTTNTEETVGGTSETGSETTPTETEVEENNETNTTPTETEETNPEETVDPEETTNLDDEVSLEDLTAEDLAQIESLRNSIFEGLDVGKGLYIQEVGLALQEMDLVDNYDFLGEEDQELPEVSECPYVEFYANTQQVSQSGCEYLVDLARSEAYSKLYGALVSKRENFDSESSEDDFWFEQGAVSGLEESRVRVRMDIKAKQICNVAPTPVESSVEKGNIVGRQHFANTMNNWLSTNGYAADYPVMSDPIEVCQADQSMLNPIYDETMSTISQAMELNPLCPDYQPVDGDDEIMYGQAQTDYANALEQGAADEFALAAVKVFKVIPCNVSDPIIIDLNGNGVFDITPVERGVNFSMTGNRQAATSWVRGDGFLFSDTNGNGIVDDGTEFFGTTGASAFGQLKAFDTNGDNQITSTDAGYNKLFVWVDMDYNGLSTTSEVYTLSHFNINTIPLEASEYQKVVNGSRVKTSVEATTTTGQTMLFGDVDFRSGIYHSPSIYKRMQTPLK